MLEKCKVNKTYVIASTVFPFPCFRENQKAIVRVGAQFRTRTRLSYEQ
jgi:hypothetical protein